MSARKLINEILMVSPAILLASIGIHAQTKSESFEIQTYSEQTEQKLLAWSEPLADLERLKLEALNKKSMEPARLWAVSSKWLQLAESKKIGPVLPQFQGDELGLGAKEQLQGGVRDLTQFHLARAMHLRESQDWDQVALETARAYEIAEILKYSDVGAVSTSCGQQRILATKLADVLPKVSKDVRSRVRKVLQPSPNHWQKLTKLIVHQTRLPRTDGKPVQSVDIATLENFWLRLNALEQVNHDEIRKFSFERLGWGDDGQAGFAILSVWELHRVLREVGIITKKPEAN